MKKLLSAIISFAILCTPVLAAESTKVETIPAQWLEPIRYPDSASVVTLYRYDKITDYLYATNRDSAIAMACGYLGEMQADEVILNVPDVSFVPINRTPGENVIELRTGEGRAMRYYLQNDGSIISQRIEEGMMYQGMKFTGGNVADTVEKLISIPVYTYGGMQISEFPLDLKEIYLYNYQDMTCTRVKNQAVLEEIEELSAKLFTEESRVESTDQAALGERMRDIHDLSLILADGTDFTVRLFEDGVRIPETTDSINVPSAVAYSLKAPLYQQLQSALRTYQSACMPLWLYNMPQNRISSITLTSAQNGRTVTVAPGEENYDLLLEMATGIVVEPLNMQQKERRSYPDAGYEIQFTLNDDNICTVDYTDSMVEVSHSGKTFVAAYRPARGAPFLPEDFGTLLDVLLDNGTSK